MAIVEQHWRGHIAGKIYEQLLGAGACRRTGAGGCTTPT
jgi:hypothetical protein